jgi:hypothetical protein
MYLSYKIVVTWIETVFDNLNFSENSRIGVEAAKVP